MELTAEQKMMLAEDCDLEEDLVFGSYHLRNDFSEEIIEADGRLTLAGCFKVIEHYGLQVAWTYDDPKQMYVWPRKSELPPNFDWCDDLSTAIHSALARIHEQRTQSE